MCVCVCVCYIVSVYIDQSNVLYEACCEATNVFSTACRRTLGVLQPRMKDIHSVLLRNPKVSMYYMDIGNYTNHLRIEMISYDTIYGE